jgi:hypothetical protein
MQKLLPFRPLSLWGRVGVVLLVVGFLAFGVLVVLRTALLERHMGDLDCYLRAAWAVRFQPDRIYDIMEDNAWHYNYPPLFAILLTPLADPPFGVDRTGMPSFAVSAAIFYLFNLVCLALAVHVLASALEWASPDAAVRGQPRGCRRWWRLRLLPVLVCLPPVAHSLMRGQANLIVLLLLCCAMAALIRGRSWLAGASLAGMACIKIFPAYLLLYPLWRREWRVAAGWVLGLIAGLILVPILVLGPAQTVASYQKLAVVLVGPALHLGQDESRAKELIEATATDSQSFLVVIHNTLHLDADRWHRVPEAAPWVRVAHFVLAALFTGLTLAAASRRRMEDGPGVVLFLGSLTVVMLVSSPVCHTHYFALSLPLVVALVAREWDRAGDMRIRPGLWLLLALQLVGNTLPLVAGLEVFKDAGLALYTALALWATACVSLWRGGTARTATPVEMAGARAA